MRHHLDRLSLLFILLAVSFTFGCVSPKPLPIWHPSNGKSFFGFVVDHEGIPIEGAEVTLIVGNSKRIVSSDKFGRFSFNGLSSGHYKTEVRKKKYMGVNFEGPHFKNDPNDFIKSEIFYISIPPIVDDSSLFQPVSK